MMLNALIRFFPDPIIKFFSKLLSLPVFYKLYYFFYDLDVALLKILKGNKEFYYFDFYGYRLAGNIRFHNGTKDSKIYDLIQSLLEKTHINEDTVLIDIGANIGLTSIIMAQYAKPKKARVFAFEPGDQIKYLRKNVQSTENDGTIIVKEKALYNQEGTLDLFTYDESIVDSRIFLDESWTTLNKNKIKSKSVPTTAFDHYIKTNHIDFSAIKLIKTDCQGAEPYIFEKMFAETEPPEELNVILEFWPYAISKLGLDPNDFLTKVHEKFKKFNLYFFMNDSDIYSMDDCGGISGLINKVGNGPNHFCDILITRFSAQELEEKLEQ